jgi:hypothetical protein
MQFTESPPRVVFDVYAAEAMVRSGADSVRIVVLQGQLECEVAENAA